MSLNDRFRDMRVTPPQSKGAAQNTFDEFGRLVRKDCKQSEKMSLNHRFRDMRVTRPQGDGIHRANDCNEPRNTFLVKENKKKWEVANWQKAGGGRGRGGGRGGGGSGNQRNQVGLGGGPNRQSGHGGGIANTGVKKSAKGSPRGPILLPSFPAALAETAPLKTKILSGGSSQNICGGEKPSPSSLSGREAATGNGLVTKTKGVLQALSTSVADNNRRKTGEAIEISYKTPSTKKKKKKNNARHRRAGGSAPGRITDAKSPPSDIHSVELVCSLSIEHAKKMQGACLTNGSMLERTVARIGFNIGDENSDVNTRNSCKVVVKTPLIAAPDDPHQYSVVLEVGCEMKRGQKSKLLEVFAKYGSVGFLEWLEGAKGWRFDCPKTERVSWKSRFVVELNTLQSIFTLFAQDEQKYFFADEKKRMVWRKHMELTEIVSDIRVWIEMINTIRPSDVTRQLLRNSYSGPDSPVHWAHHHPKTDYPLTVVSEATMQELVAGIITLFQTEFSHTESDPLGKRWRNYEKRRLNDWKDAAKVCPEWTEDRLEKLLEKQ